MKKITLFLLALTGVFASAQTYTTGVVNLGTSITAKIETTSTTVTLTMTGPSDRWFAVGFGNNSMNSGDVVIVNSASTISDRNFQPAAGGGFQTPIADTNDWVLSSVPTVSGTTRTVIATRALTTVETTLDYQFSNSADTFQMCYVRNGSSSFTLGPHGGSATGGNAQASKVLSNDSFFLAGFKLYPNPADEIFAIELPANVNAVTVKMYDVLGKLVLTKEITALQNKLDITTLKAGNYIVKVSGDDKEYSTNLIIQ